MPAVWKECSERLQPKWRRHGGLGADMGKHQGKAEMLHSLGMQGRAYLFILHIKLDLFHSPFHQKQKVQDLILMAPSLPVDYRKTPRAYTFRHSHWTGKTPLSSLAWTLELIPYHLSSVPHHPSSVPHHPSRVPYHSSIVSHHLPSVPHHPPSVPHHPPRVPHHPSSIPHHPYQVSHHLSSAVISCRKVLLAQCPGGQNGPSKGGHDGSDIHPGCEKLWNLQALLRNPPGVRLLTSSTPLNFGGSLLFPPIGVCEFIKKGPDLRKSPAQVTPCDLCSCLGGLGFFLNWAFYRVPGICQALFICCSSLTMLCNR